MQKNLKNSRGTDTYDLSFSLWLAATNIYVMYGTPNISVVQELLSFKSIIIKQYEIHTDISLVYSESHSWASKYMLRPVINQHVPCFRVAAHPKLFPIRVIKHSQNETPTKVLTTFPVQIPKSIVSGSVDLSLAQLYIRVIEMNYGCLDAKPLCFPTSKLGILCRNLPKD